MEQIASWHILIIFLKHFQMFCNVQCSVVFSVIVSDLCGTLNSVHNVAMVWHYVPVRYKGYHRNVVDPSKLLKWYIRYMEGYVAIKKEINNMKLKKKK